MKIYPKVVASVNGIVYTFVGDEIEGDETTRSAMLAVLETAMEQDKYITLDKPNDDFVIIPTKHIWYIEVKKTEVDENGTEGTSEGSNPTSG